MNELKNLKYFKIKEFCEIFYNGIFGSDLFLSYLNLQGEENQNSHLRYQNNGALLNISSESQLSFVFCFLLFK